MYEGSLCERRNWKQVSKVRSALERILMISKKKMYWSSAFLILKTFSFSKKIHRYSIRVMNQVYWILSLYRLSYIYTSNGAFPRDGYQLSVLSRFDSIFVLFVWAPFSSEQLTSISCFAIYRECTQTEISFIIFIIIIVFTDVSTRNRRSISILLAIDTFFLECLLSHISNS